jgi:hypothetical protein
MVEKDGGAMHFSADKPGVDQVPPELLIEWGDVFTYGEKKYARDNWKRGTNWHEFYGSALRHLYRWWNGEDVDPETGLPHLAHALWNVGALRYYQIHDLGTDNRPEPPPTTVTLERPVIGPGEAAVIQNGDIIAVMDSPSYPTMRAQEQDYRGAKKS